MAREVEAGNRFIFATLSEDSAVAALVGDRIFSSSAPEEADLPYIIYDQMTSPYTYFLQGGDPAGRVAQQPTYQVKAVTEGVDKQAAYDINAALDTVLAGASLTMTLDGINYHIQGCSREGDIDYISNDEGVRVNYIGGIYKLFISKGP